MMQVKTFEDDIRAIFERMKIIDPVDGVEFIPPKFITPALHDLGLNPTNNEIHEMLAVIDPKQEGRITYDAFCSFARQMSDTHLDEALLNKCFALFDTNHDGVLSTQEFSLALQHNGEGLSNEELELALQIADSDRNGSITYAEFVAYMIQRDHLSSDLRERIMSFRAQQSVNTNAESLRHGSMRTMARNASIRASSPMKIEEAPVEPLSRTKSSNQETVVETEGEEEDVSALLKQIEDEELSTRHEMIHDSTKKFEKAMQDAGFQIGADGKFVCTKAMTTHSNKNNTKPVAKKDSKKCCVIS